jgi:hypothetical protein
MEYSILKKLNSPQTTLFLSSMALAVVSGSLVASLNTTVFANDGMHTKPAHQMDKHGHHHSKKWQEKWDSMTPEQQAQAKARHAKMKEKWDSMSPEEKKQARQFHQARKEAWKNMSPEEREAKKAEWKSMSPEERHAAMKERKQEWLKNNNN